MRKAAISLLALALFSTGCGDLPSAPPDSALTPSPAPDAAFARAASELTFAGTPYVVVFNQGRAPADVEDLVSSAGGELVFSFPQVGIAVARALEPSFPDVVGKNRAVLEVGPTGRWTLPPTGTLVRESDGPTATDDLYGWYQWDIRRVGADQAWAAGATGSHNTVVAILDMGIDATHPDLAPNVVYSACMQLGGPCPADKLTGWHGTHVAGIVAAAFGGGRAVGVGPNLGLAGYQVFEDPDAEGNAGAADPVLWWAILDAAQRGYEVINMSLGGYFLFAQTAGMGGAVWTTWNRVVGYAVNQGVTVVASAGNYSFNLNGTVYHFPGDLPGIINVAATGIRPDPVFPQDGAYDVQADYSNYGAQVTLSAPGGDCGGSGDCSGISPSGYPDWMHLVLSTYPGGYAWTGGTSQASPHVAGAAGLIMDRNPRLNPRQVRAILMRTADKIGSRQLFGQGMLNVLDAVLAASN